MKINERDVAQCCTMLHPWIYMDDQASISTGTMDAARVCHTLFSLKIFEIPTLLQTIPNSCCLLLLPRDIRLGYHLGLKQGKHGVQKDPQGLVQRFKASRTVKISQLQLHTALGAVSRKSEPQSTITASMNMIEPLGRLNIFELVF